MRQFSKFKRVWISALAVLCTISFVAAISANAVVEPERSASTGNQKANGYTVSGTVIQYNKYMLGITTCSNVNAHKKAKNIYYYYYNSSGNFKKIAVENAPYVINGFTSYTERTNFVSGAASNVCGVKCKHYVKYNGTIIWSDTTKAGKTTK